MGLRILIVGNALGLPLFRFRETTKPSGKLALLILGILNDIFCWALVFVMSRSHGHLVCMTAQT